MKQIQGSIVATAHMLIAIIIFSCSDTTDDVNREREHGEAGNEESGTQYAQDDTCDEVYNGV